ncbi:MAG TPA: hypothetical protein VFV90_12440 [Usitatibacter sp.]|jgi:hypothetical protein|nr:hypothetical protein [Usitatibacter sp.]
MTPAGSQPPRQVPVASWIAQMIGTIVLSLVVFYFIRERGMALPEVDPDWKRYAAAGSLLGIVPAMLYLRIFKEALDADDAAIRARGVPDPTIRPIFMRALAIGGALCEIPMAMGVLHLLFGGETRWFVGATCITIALRLSYRPFKKA